jgi:hypothetical protein
LAKYQADLANQASSKTETQKTNLDNLKLELAKYQADLQAKQQSESLARAKEIDEYKLAIAKNQTDSQPKYETKEVTVGSGNSSKTYLITYDQNGKEVKREYMGSGTSGTTGTTSSGNTSSGSSIESKVQSYFSGVIGGDGYVSPSDWQAARAAYVKDGGNATTFDTKFKGYKNPNNQYY